MSESYVYANQPGTVTHHGQRIMIKPGEAWDPNDPVVRAYPGYFNSTPAYIRTSENDEGHRAPGEVRTVVADPDEPSDAGKIERATRAPGETRPVKGINRGRAGR